MIEAFGMWASVILGIVVFLALWLIWMFFGLVLFLSQANNPTGGKSWIALFGVAVMLSGLGAVGYLVFWIISHLKV